MNIKIKWIWAVAIILVLVGYLWNSYRYNVWSSYDAGGHLEYAVDLGLGKGLPQPKTNYLAWHEPGYYWLAGTGARLIGGLDWPRPRLYKAWQYGSAVVMWVGALGAGLLAWQLTQRKNLAWLAAIATASLFCWSALARYMTNEGMFQAGVLWWLVCFLWWRMDEPPQWSRVKWLLLILGLVTLLWIKLTAVVLIAAVAIWVLLQRGVALKTRVKWMAVIVLVPGLLYSPWLYHKHQLYGQALTINNYERSVDRMPWRFFVSWDNSVMFTPFWISARGSFGSMVLASAIVDYDNIFEVYDRPAKDDLVTGNGMRLAAARATASVQLVRWSMGVIVWIAFGFVLLAWQWLRGRALPRVQIVAITALGLVAALMYNVWRYPQIGRGTLKAIFIAAAFPLLAIAASAAWQELWPNRPRWISALLLLYWAVWIALSWRIGLLPV